MFKFLIKVLLSVSFSFYANASIIDDLSDEQFVQYENLQWAWASPVNVELFYDFGVIANTLYGPSFEIEIENEIFSFNHGWRYATNEELNFFVSNNLSELFRIENAAQGFTYIDAFSVWNSGINYAQATFWDYNIINGGGVASQQSILGETPYNPTWNTFYVRDVESDSAATSVPEPATLLIFSFALIALSFRSKFVK